MTYRSSLLTLMFIDLERDSAIRVQALMALAAYSVRHYPNKFGTALTYSYLWATNCWEL